MSGSAAAAPCIVKKHANRRLYSVHTGSYVTLDDLAAMVRQSQDFVVVDNRTGEDITHATLAQILFAQESRTRQNLLSTEFMFKLLRLHGDGLAPLVPEYLDTTLSILAERRKPAQPPQPLG